MKKLLDPSEVGGTRLPWHQQACAQGPRLLRCPRPSDNAVFRAVEYAQSGIIADVEAHIDVMKVEKNG